MLWLWGSALRHTPAVGELLMFLVGHAKHLRAKAFEGGVVDAEALGGLAGNGSLDLYLSGGSRMG